MFVFFLPSSRELADSMWIYLLFLYILIIMVYFDLAHLTVWPIHKSGFCMCVICGCRMYDPAVILQFFVHQSGKMKRNIYKIIITQ